MAVLQMQRICICALKKDRKKILELLQRRGMIEITDEIEEDGIFRKTDAKTTSNQFERNISLAKDALQILEHYVSDKKSPFASLTGRREVDVSVYDTFTEKYQSVLKTVNRVNHLAKLIAENKAEILKLQAQKEMLYPWLELDVPLNFSGTKATKSYIGTLPNLWTLDMIYEKLAEFTPFNAEIVSASRDQTCFFILCPKDKAEALSEQLRTIGFSYPNILIDKTAKEQQVSLDEMINEAQDIIINSEKEVNSYKEQIEDIQFLVDYEIMRVEKYEVISHLLQSEKAFILTGYIPKEDTEEISKDLNQKFDVSIEVQETAKDEDIPIKLHNNAFANPLEGTVEAFSPPGKDDIDPTFIMSLFYYMLFGLMLSDAGYGIIMTIGCFAGLRLFKNTLEDSMRKSLRMFLFCGISTVFWGVLFGSYFGDLLDVFTESFLGYKVTIPALWFMPLNEPMRMLVFSMLLGIIHIFAGLGIKFYLCIKKKDIQTLIYDVILWYVLLISSIIILLSTQMIIDIFGIDLGISSSLVSICGVLAGIAAVGIILTNGRESKNPFKRILKGAYALYGISGYLSDVLSYSRLLALGLATGVICNVINKMAGMASGGPIGIVFFVLIVLIGHTLNIGINALGAYVHTNRLQYVEFFGKFYEGGGRMFKPFHAETKYFKIKENKNNG